jgi:hypothetical protein
MAKPGFARRSRNAGRHGNPPRVFIFAMAEPGFARRSRNAGRHGNPPRVFISMVGRGDRLARTEQAPDLAPKTLCDDRL